MMILKIAQNAKISARRISRVNAEQKRNALNLIADQLWKQRSPILAANLLDVEEGMHSGLSAALIDRLTLNEKRLEGIIGEIRSVAELPDPVGEIFDAKTLPNGLRVRKQRVPLGVLAVIYESRPNVTVDTACLAIKSGNAVILRGGKETINSNRALAAAIRTGLTVCELPADTVQLIDSPDRSLVLELLRMYQYIDMVIPRGGQVLHQFCRENSLIPVITGGMGICHLYVDESADLAGASEVIRNAKIQRPSVCNALDTLLVNAKIAGAFVPALIDRLAMDGVTFRADTRALTLLKARPDGLVLPAGPDDFSTEWMSLTLGIKVVENLDEAITHIQQHGDHSDGILTNNQGNAERFIAEIDSAVVYVNASTRFTDGGQMGLGAEVAVSTQRLHARGPMALQELTTYKWVVEGDYHTRS